MKDSAGPGGGLADHDHLVPRYTFEPLTVDQALAVAVGVIVRGIEVVDTQIDGAGDDGGIGRETGRPPRPGKPSIPFFPRFDREWKMALRKRGAGASAREPDGGEGQPHSEKVSA
jgi:hypothetical protein